MPRGRNIHADTGHMDESHGLPAPWPHASPHASPLALDTLISARRYGSATRSHVLTQEYGCMSRTTHRRRTPRGARRWTRLAFLLGLALVVVLAILAVH